MADILIKNMKMPESCHDCCLTDGWNCYTSLEYKDNEAYCDSKTKPDWCPLVEVPTPHGRLGDLDKLEQMFVDIDNAPYSGFDGYEPFYSAEDAAQIIRLSPTIIEADGRT